MLDVVKRNGRKEPFNEAKVRESIESAVKDAGLDVRDKSNQIAHVIGDTMRLAITQGDEDAQGGTDNEISTGDIRSHVLHDLENEIPEAAQAWKNWEKKHEINY